MKQPKRVRFAFGPQSSKNGASPDRKPFPQALRGPRPTERLRTKRLKTEVFSQAPRGPRPTERPRTKRLKTEVFSQALRGPRPTERPRTNGHTMKIVPHISRSSRRPNIHATQTRDGLEARVAEIGQEMDHFNAMHSLDSFPLDQSRIRKILQIRSVERDRRGRLLPRAREVFMSPKGALYYKLTVRTANGRRKRRRKYLSTRQAQRCLQGTLPHFGGVCA